VEPLFTALLSMGRDVSEIVDGFEVFAGDIEPRLHRAEACAEAMAFAWTGPFPCCVGAVGGAVADTWPIGFE
jgi:hypothetical protein